MNVKDTLLAMLKNGMDLVVVASDGDDDGSHGDAFRWLVAQAYHS